MARNISFAKTKQQIRDRSKTVTRRFGWAFLKSGDILCGVEKGMGLKKGEQVVRLAMIDVVSVRRERVDAITQGDVVREGFPDLTPDQFIDDVLLKGAKVPNGEGGHRPATRADICTRIEFGYLPKF